MAFLKIFVQMEKMPLERPELLILAQGAHGLKSDRHSSADFYRGVALWFVFIDHIPGNICSWLTLQHYGFSDATELFMFISGLTCSAAYSAVLRDAGWWAVIGHTLQRSKEIYASFLLLIIAIIVLVFCVGDEKLSNYANVTVLLERLAVAFYHAVWMQYRPLNADVLPTFVIFHLMFAPLLWALLKNPDGALAASLSLYAVTHAAGLNFPQWPYVRGSSIRLRGRCSLLSAHGGR